MRAVVDFPCLLLSSFNGYCICSGCMLSSVSSSSAGTRYLVAGTCDARTIVGEIPGRVKSLFCAEKRGGGWLEERSVEEYVSVADLCTDAYMLCQVFVHYTRV